MFCLHSYNFISISMWHRLWQKNSCLVPLNCNSFLIIDKQFIWWYIDMLPTSSNLYKGTLNTGSKIFWMSNISQLSTFPLDHRAELCNVQLVTFGTRAQQAACRCPTGNWQITSGPHTTAWDWLICNILFVIRLPLDSSFCLSPVLLSIIGIKTKC